jgi:hypothetical protein
MRAAIKRERLLSLSLFVLLLVVLALLVGPYVLRNFLEPLALGVWLLLRVFVLSIDQGVLWGLMVLVVVVWFIVRPNRNSRPLYEEGEIARNAALRDLEGWSYLFSEKPRASGEFGSLQRELAWTLCAVYASRKRIRSDYEVRDAFEQGRIPLGEGIYSFLFAQAKAKATIKTKAKKRGEYDRLAMECLDYLESQLEIRDDDE